MGSQPDHTHEEIFGDLNEMTPEVKRQLRCGHVLAPGMLISSPVIGDLNSDGKLEVVYVMMWKAADKDAPHTPPPSFTVHVAPLEERVGEVFGQEGVEWVHSFLPGDQQPWTRYMGSGGDNVYRRPPFNKT